MKFVQSNNRSKYFLIIVCSMYFRRCRRERSRGQSQEWVGTFSTADRSLHRRGSQVQQNATGKWYLLYSHISLNGTFSLFSKVAMFENAVLLCYPFKCNNEHHTTYIGIIISHNHNSHNHFNQKCCGCK